MSDSPALLIGERILDDELVSGALDAYAASFNNVYTLADCAVHLVKLSLVREGWIVSRQVEEYAASPKLDAFRAAEKPASPKAPKRRGSVLRLVPQEGAGGRS